MGDKKKPTFRLRGFSEAECVVVGGDPAGDGSEGGMRMGDLVKLMDGAAIFINGDDCEGGNVWRDLKGRIEELERERDRLAALRKEAGEALEWAQTHLESVGLHSTSVDTTRARMKEETDGRA